MKQMPSKEALAEFIKQRLKYKPRIKTCSYNGLSIETTDYYRPGGLAMGKIEFAKEINCLLGFESGDFENEETTEGMIYRKIDDFDNENRLTGNKEVDAQALAKDIWHLFWDDPDGK